MNEKLVSTVTQKFQSKTTDELLAIWNEDKRDEYSDEAFEAIRRILAGRGHILAAKVASEEINNIERTQASGPRGTNYVCPECYVAFTQQRPPSRSFLGFVRFACPQCGKNVLYPLTKGYRIFYWVFVAVVSVLVVVMFRQGYVVSPGAVWVAGIVALGSDGEIKRRVRRAWSEHDRRGQPQTIQPALSEQERITSLDPIRWFHVVFAILLPYVAVPWGIVNIVRGKKRSGVLLLVVPGVVVGLMVAIVLIATKAT